MNLEAIGWPEVAAVVVLAILGVNNADLALHYLRKAGDSVKGLFASGTKKPTKAPAPGPTEAFAAAQLLIAYFDEEGCREGVEAAKAAGRCLFHAAEDHK